MDWTKMPFVRYSYQFKKLFLRITPLASILLLLLLVLTACDSPTTPPYLLTPGIPINFTAQVTTGSFDSHAGILTIVEKVNKATLSATSFKRSLIASDDSGITTQLSIYVRPAKISTISQSQSKGTITYSYFIGIGENGYASSDGQTWTKHDEDYLVYYQFNPIRFSQFGRDIFTILPDEQLADGRVVGVFSIDGRNYSSNGVTTFKYDKQTFRLVEVIVKESNIDTSDYLYSDYDDPTNKVEIPAADKILTSTPSTPTKRWEP
jgi:hypothetical protein